MVMHARKLPRIDDGYYDCHDYHELKNSNCERKLARDRRIRDEHDMISDRQGSPTFRHKHIPPADRRKLERDRRDKYNQLAEYTVKENSKLGENNTNHADRLSGNHISDHKSVDTRIDANASASRLKDRDSLVKSEDYKKTSSSIKSNTAGGAKDPRVEAQKTALRVCGDWSEHVSSSGKKYFYNCKTEVSQWVKPKEWKSDDLAKQGRLKAPSTAPTKGGEDACRNGLDEHTDSPSRLRCERVSEESRSGVNEHKSDTYHRRHNSSNADSVSHEQTLAGREVNNYQMLRRSHDRSSSVTSTPSSSVVDTSNGSPTNGMHVDKNISSDRLHLHNGTIADDSGDDMDISPDMSPKQLLDSQCNNELTCNIGSAGEHKLAAHRSDGQPPTGNSDQSMIWGKALETLQTLQEVLERSRTVSSQPGGNSIRATLDSPRSATSQSSPRTIPLSAQHIPAASEITDASYSVPGDKSPAASEASLGQHSALSSAAESCSSINVLLPQSLVNFYDPTMVSHISNWPAEQLELRAHMAYRDGLVICGHHCGQVSTELKRDRSHVRIAEVQSTLIEHRILFLKQQISELETQERSFSSGHT